MTENKDLKAEIQKLKDANEIALIRTSCADTPAADLRNMINACKIRNVESIGDLAIFIQETKNQTLQPPDLIQINAILAHDLKKLQEDVKIQKKLENQQLEVNGWEECDKAIIHSKELPQTEIHVEIMQHSLEKQLAEAREEKGDLEKTYRYAVHEIKKKLQEKLANHHIENENGQKQIRHYL